MRKMHNYLFQRYIIAKSYRDHQATLTHTRQLSGVASTFLHNMSASIPVHAYSTHLEGQALHFSRRIQAAVQITELL